MTTAEERTRSVLDAKDFLTALAHPRCIADVPEPIKLQAEILLRHYPSRIDMELAGLACPCSFAAPSTFGKPKPKSKIEALESGGTKSAVDWVVEKSSWIFYTIAIVTALASALLVFALLKDIH